jgi:hypothetical protein
MRSKVIPLIITILAVSIKTYGHDSIVIKKNRFYVHLGRSHWNNPTLDQLEDITSKYVAFRTIDLGVHFERKFSPKFYYNISLNYMQLNTQMDLNFNRNNFYPYFNSDTSGTFRSRSFSNYFENKSFGLSGTIGYEWIQSNAFLLKSCAGFNFAHFITKESRFIEYESIGGVPFGEALAIINQPEPTSSRRLVVPALRLGIEFVFTKTKLNFGLGFNVNLGLERLFESKPAVDFLPFSSDYRRITNSEMRFNYSGIRFFVGF